MTNFKEEIRRFNRFYTRMIGINNQYTDQSKYSATEALILYEISIKANCTAGSLCDFFNLDKGYLSRILKHFEGDELIKKIPSEDDKRVFLLVITEKGEDELRNLIESANKTVSNVIQNIPDHKKEELIEAMRKIETIFEQHKSTNL